MSSGTTSVLLLCPVVLFRTLVLATKANLIEVWTKWSPKDEVTGGSETEAARRAGP